jgi:hypothetical protein
MILQYCDPIPKQWTLLGKPETLCSESIILLTAVLESVPRKHSWSDLR